ncbi:unnamed protein product [Onchocerca flexuosa]|uniref:Uncharacterized protein n=1 Tax=Onchocerca flexuosa TaxID=387005 RepID=A0A183HL36_9BILA|nr:unnamed protein product [Onchocerca flexuosa]
MLKKKIAVEQDFKKNSKAIYLGINAPFLHGFIFDILPRKTPHRLTEYDERMEAKIQTFNFWNLCNKFPTVTLSRKKIENLPMGK